MALHRRAYLGLSVVDWAVLAAYFAVLCLGLSHYLPWEDEGRAWIDARFFGLFNLVFHVLRYEGHPPIWYLILWPLAHAHVPFYFINWISAACGFSGIYFLLRFSPFPVYLRALLPFGFALAYEYAVVARSYCLFPLFGFMIAHEYRQPTRRPVRMAIYLALLSNLSVHGTIVAVVFGVSYAWDLYRERRGAAEPTWTLPQARLGAGVFAASLAFVLIVLWPAHDLKPPVSPELGKAIHKIAPVAYHPDAPSQTVSLLRVGWNQPRDGAAHAPEFTTQTPPQLNLGMGSLKIRARLWSVFAYPIAVFTPLAILFQGLVFALVWRRGKPILIAAPLLLGAFIVQVYFKLWHTSLMWVALIMLLWAVWDEREKFQLRSLQSCAATVFAIVCLLQIPWTVAALRFERANPTYPAKAAADFLKTLPKQSRVDGFDHAFTLLPYFNDFPFFRQTEILDVPTVLADKPDVILFRNSTATDGQLSELAQAGYRETHDFCGTPFFPNQPLSTLCLVVLEKP
jgi:hypothetical protein